MKGFPGAGRRSWRRGRVGRSRRGVVGRLQVAQAAARYPRPANRRARFSPSTRAQSQRARPRGMSSGDRERCPTLLLTGKVIILGTKKGLSYQEI